MDSDTPKHVSVDAPKPTLLATFTKLFAYPPKNAWNAVLTQLLCWSFRRFCVVRLTDLSGEIPLWDSHFNLVDSFAPPQFKPHLDQWLAPENLTHVGNLGQLDTTFRTLVDELDKSVAAEDADAQDELANLLDEDMGQLLEAWLGTVYAPYSIFPEPEEPDDSIDMTKLNAVKYLLDRQILLTKMRIQKRRVTHRANIVRAATPIKKTRRNKQNVHVRFSPETCGHDARREGDQNNEGEREQREGDKVSDTTEKRDPQSEAPPSHEEGNNQHPQPQVHAEPVQTPHEDTTVSDATASIQQDNKEDEKERA